MIKLSSLYELAASAKIRSAKEASRHPAFMDKYPVDWARWAYMPIVDEFFKFSFLVLLGEKCMGCRVIDFILLPLCLVWFRQ